MKKRTDGDRCATDTGNDDFMRESKRRRPEETPCTYIWYEASSSKTEERRQRVTRSCVLFRHFPVSTHKKEAIRKKKVNYMAIRAANAHSRKNQRLPLPTLGALAVRIIFK